MSYRQTEQQFFKKSWVWREKFLSPVLELLHKAKITANHITYFRAILFMFVVMYPLYIKGDVFWATAGYFLIFWLLDTIDGQLARHTKTSSDKGKFNDIFIDITGYSLYMMGLAFIGVSEVFILFYHVIIHAADYLLAIVYRNENQPTDWIIRAEPNLSYLKIIAHLTIIIFVLFGRNFIDPMFMMLNVFMTLQAINYFIKIQKQSFKKR